MLSNPAVETEYLDEGIVRVTMRDEASKNAFSDELVNGLYDTFTKISRSSDLKVVILTGYGNYFSSGGTQEQLLRQSEGIKKFTECDLYSLSLNCPIPVISAMQGHGIGGGFVIGLFGDFVILSRESIYTVNFMKYGFTPGMGATLILPEKLGLSLSEEMLLSAKTYYGEELHKRGIAFPVIPRKDVEHYALDLAKTLSEKPRVSLVTLKDHLVYKLRDKLAKVIEQELVMHEKTFHLPEVKEKIEKAY